MADGGRVSKGVSTVRAREKTTVTPTDDVDPIQYGMDAVRHTSPNRAHVNTPYVMLPYHHINFLHF